MKSVEWKTYRTRFLVKAKQLSSSLSFVDHLGRQHCGRKGDYLVESSDGVISIAPRQIFEDIYVPMSLLGEPGTGEILIGDKTLGEKTIGDTAPGERMIRKATASEPKFSRLKFEALQIEQVKLGKRPVSRQRVDETRMLPNDEGARVRRKLPQSCRDRRDSAPNLRLM